MLRISKLADYGTVVMVYLAKQEPRLCNAREIALHTHLNLPTVSKILKSLLAARLLTSVLGSAGGYKLQRSADEISVMDILHAVDISRGLTECSLQPNACILHEVCRVQDNWRLISQVMNAALARVSLKMLAGPKISNLSWFLPATELVAAPLELE